MATKVTQETQDLTDLNQLGGQEPTRQGSKGQHHFSVLTWGGENNSAIFEKKLFESFCLSANLQLLTKRSE